MSVSIYKRGSRYWYSFVFNGERIQASAKVKNAKDARDIEKAAWNNLARGAVGLPPKEGQKNTTISELLDALESNYAEQGKISPQKKSLLKQARVAFGSKVAARLTSEDVEKYIAAERAQGKRNATINRVTEIVRRAYHLAKLTAPEVRHLSEKNNTREGFFSRAEFDRVYSHLPADLADFSLFCLLTAWRKGEAASLTWNDVEDGVIRLRGANSKNGESRCVAIAGELAALLERRRTAKSIKTESGATFSSFVFHRDGRPIAQFRKAWATATRKAGCAGRLFHDLRRSGIRDMIRSGVPQSVAMKISGHKTASMFRRYDIASEDDLRTAIECVHRYHQSQAQKVIGIANTV
jgi:integrase